MLIKNSTLIVPLTEKIKLTTGVSQTEELYFGESFSLQLTATVNW